ncbi:MAG: CHASE domain-containing protein [Candidatus Doudnabacteria bacterium]
MNRKSLTKYLPYIVLTASLFATILSWRFAKSSTESYSRTQLEVATVSLKHVIKDRLENSAGILQGGAGLFAASDNVTREEWRRFSEILQVRERVAGIQGLGFARVFPAQQKLEIERQVRTEGYPDFQVFPDNGQKEFTSIVFLEPMDERNLRAFGYDMFTEANRREAMEYARDSGAVSMSKRITLLQETDQDVQPGFLTYLAVYKNGVVPETVEQRRSDLLGYVYSPIRAGDFLALIANDKHPDLEFQIFDGRGDLNQKNLMYSSSSELLKAGYSGWYSSTAEIDFGGNTWTIRFVTDSSFGLSPVQKAAPIVILILGIILSFWLMHLVRYVVNQNSADLKRTASELSTYQFRADEEEVIIERDPRAIIATNVSGIITLINQKAQKHLEYKEEEVSNLANLVNFVVAEQINKLAAELTQRTGIRTEANFETLITDSLIEGLDKKQLTMITKSGKKIDVLVEIKPLYSDRNDLLGYEFTF